VWSDRPDEHDRVGALGSLVSVGAVIGRRRLGQAVGALDDPRDVHARVGAEAESAEDALALLPYFVAERSSATEVSPVMIP
jgi:hypothetical protein